MVGFCKECGRPLNPEGLCTDRGCPGSKTSGVGDRKGSRIGPLPKPNTTRRLLGSGIEYLAYVIGGWVISFFSTLSGGLFGIASILLFSLIILRDFNAGALSIAKRVSQMRVVDSRTGRIPSNTQALLRNSYYGALAIAMALPAIDWLFYTLFFMFVFFDTMMVLASPRGRRIGDLLAHTQVVEARS